ncbi:unnamed protein product [Ophioblennius macclurei]
MGEVLGASEVEKAKTFWSEEDVDQVFDGVLVYLNHLRTALKSNTATDKEFVQAFRLLESLDCSSPESPQNQDQNADQEQDPSVVQVVIGSDELLPADFLSPTSPKVSSCSPVVPPVDREELLPPLSLTNLQYQRHDCSKACVPGLPGTHQAVPPFWAQNPLKMPLLCGFVRFKAESYVGDDACEQYDTEGCDIIYKAPCGRSLRNYEEVMSFLLSTESFDLLQVDFFTFNPMVQVDPPPVAGPRIPEQDLSRGAEPTPVELCVGTAGVRPPDFRYRKERWPHGCFLSRGPALFDACCDCTDGCSDAQRCACVAMTTGGHHYRHHRLQEPVPSGLYECGPWCGCVRARCMNRLVQRGITIRLQVFETNDRGWGVRCRDDLDAGTFVCIFAGVILRQLPPPPELLPPKLTRADLPSDDEVEVVTEWLAPPILEGRGNQLDTPPPTSPPLHVPVIKRQGDATNTPQDQDQVQAVLVGSPKETPRVAEGSPPALDKRVTMTKAVTGTKSLKEAMKVEDICYIDSSREGNVSRFINHSCQPNLFIQNVFTDSHDAAFPVIAFFTSRAVPAGSELTWNYNTGSHMVPMATQDVTCLCGSECCHGQFTIEEMLCDSCEVDGHVAMEC